MTAPASRPVGRRGHARAPSTTPAASVSTSATWNGTAANPSSVRAIPEAIAPSGRTSAGHHGASAAGVSAIAGASPQAANTTSVAAATRATPGIADVPATPASAATATAAIAAAATPAAQAAALPDAGDMVLGRSRGPGAAPVPVMRRDAAWMPARPGAPGSPRGAARRRARRGRGFRPERAPDGRRLRRSRRAPAPPAAPRRGGCARPTRARAMPKLSNTGELFGRNCAARWRCSAASAQRFCARQSAPSNARASA